MTNYQKILKIIGYSTINRLFELEGYKFTDFVENGVKYIIKNTLNLKVLDSNNENYSNRNNDESVVKIYSIVEYTKDKKVDDIVDIGDFFKVKILESSLNISSTKVLYVEINKKLLK